MISDTLVATMYFGVQCLNPCFNGRWSQTRDGALRARVPVLILALMEDSLGLYKAEYGMECVRLNPCFNGRWSRTRRNRRHRIL